MNFLVSERGYTQAINLTCDYFIRWSLQSSCRLAVHCISVALNSSSLLLTVDSLSLK
jgi:hypothetical protein